MSDLIDRSQEIGSVFLAWRPETGPCPISINDHYWFKKLCALFEKQAELETMLSTTKQELAFWKGYALHVNNHMLELRNSAVDKKRREKR